MTLENIALHLQAEGHGTAGTSIFVDMMGAELREGITLRKWSGRWHEDYRGQLREIHFQVVLRGPDYQAGDLKMENLLPALTVDQKTIGTAYFYNIHPVEEPIAFGREAAGVATFVVNCKAIYRLT